MHEKGKQERKEQKKEKERKEKKRKKQPHSNWVSHPSHHYRIIEPNHPLHHLIFSSSHLLISIHSSKNPPIPMLNSNLAYSKKVQKVSKKPKYITYTNHQVCLSVYPGSKKKTEKRKTYTSPDNDHVHTPNSRKFSAPQSFRLRRDNMSNEDKVPTPIIPTH